MFFKRWIDSLKEMAWRLRGERRLSRLRKLRKADPPPPPTKLEELVTMANAAHNAVQLLGYKIEDAVAEKLLQHPELSTHPAIQAHQQASFFVARTRDELKIEVSNGDQ